MRGRRDGLRRLRGLASLAGFLTALGCADATAPSVSALCPALEVSSGGRGRSLVFVLSDTLRRDRLGAYGSPARTPGFDAFARDALLFQRASSQAPWTKPSIATLFTGLYPARHGVVSHPALRGDGSGPLRSDRLLPDHTTLAESLQAAGYETAAFVGNPWLQRSLGFDQGFDVYDDRFAKNGVGGMVVTKAGIDWIRSREDERPFFLYLHYMDAHSPYGRVPDVELARRAEAVRSDTRPASGPARDAIASRALAADGGSLIERGLPANLALMELVYDQGVQRFDHALRRLLTQLAAEPEAHDAAIVVTSDHGEALFQRGWGSHGNGLYEDELAIPLAMQLPGVRAHGPITCPVGLVDLRATLCAYLEVACRGENQGRSLLATEGVREGIVVSEGVIGRHGHRAARDHRYKLLHEPQGRRLPHMEPARALFALHDLEADPEERRDLLAGALDPAQRAAFERLREAVEADLAGEGAPARSFAPLDDATRKRLEELGYLETDGA